jgi:hypothetical protein
MNTEVGRSFLLFLKSYSFKRAEVGDKKNRGGTKLSILRKKE